MFLEFTYFLVYAVLLVLTASVGVVTYFWKSLPGTFRYLSLYLYWNLFIEVFVYLVEMENNLPLLHLYTLFEFLLITLFYFQTGIFDAWSKRTQMMYLVGVAALIVFNSVFFQSIYTFNSYAKTLVQILLIAYAVAFVFRLKPTDTEVRALNWANAAVLIYYSGSLFIYMFSNVFIWSAMGKYFAGINVILNLAFQVLIHISVWKAARIRKLQF